MKLRFSRVGGWVVGMGGCIARYAHRREKFATNFRNVSIHRFLPVMGEWSRIRLSSA
jgi:hypothetical protein